MSNIHKLMKKPVDEVNFFKSQVDAAQEFHDRGIDFCYVHHDYDKALVELYKAATLRESLIGKYHNDTALTYFRIISVLREEKKDYRGAMVVARREFRISQLLLGQSDYLTILSQEAWLAERIEWIKQVLTDSKDFDAKKSVVYCEQLLQALEYERLGDERVAAKQWEMAIKEYNCALALESSAYARNELDMADIHTKVRVKGRYMPDLVTVQC
jgi:hypothetical protein